MGLLIGNFDCTVEKVLIALDLTRSVLQQAKKLNVDLIITHHPIIFKPVKSIKSTSLLFDVVNSKINVVAMHTNLDLAQSGVSFCLAEFLKLKNIQILNGSDGFGRVGFLQNKLSCSNFLNFVSKKLNTVVKATKMEGFVQKVAVVSGAGGFAVKPAILNGADVLVTGECRHSDFVDALNANFFLVCAGHFATEVVFVKPLKEKLEKAFGLIKFFVAQEVAPASFFYGDLKWL